MNDAISEIIAAKEAAQDPINMLGIDPPNADFTVEIDGSEPFVKALMEKYGFSLEEETKKDKVGVKGKTPTERKEEFSQVLGELYKYYLAELIEKYDVELPDGPIRGVDVRGAIEEKGMNAKMEVGQVLGETVKITPGGSTANTSRTLKKLHGDNINPTIVTAANDQDRYGREVSAVMDKEKIHRHPDPDHFPEDVRQSQFANLVMVFTEGENKGSRLILKSSSPLGKSVTEEMVTKELIQDNDTVLIQGSGWVKQSPAVMDKVMHERWAEGKEVILTLPTNHDLLYTTNDHGTEVPNPYNDDITYIDKFRSMLHSANVVMANEGEISWLFDNKEYAFDGPEGQKQYVDEQGNASALEELRRSFERESMAVFRDEGKHDLLEKAGAQVGFVTAGGEGAFLIEAAKNEHDQYIVELNGKDGKPEQVYADSLSAVAELASHMKKTGNDVRLKYDIKHIEGKHIDKADMVSSLGAGDTTYAGFIYGRQIGLSNEEAAEVSQVLGRDNLKQVGAVIDDPRASLRQAIEAGEIENASQTLKDAVGYVAGAGASTNVINR